MTLTPTKVTPLPYVVMSNVTSKPINWLWRPYIPRGHVTMIVGDGGYGKSYMVCALAAALSTGEALPGQAALRPQNVLIISAEDDMGYILKPRLEALGADMSRIGAYDEAFTLNERNVERVSQAVKDFDVTVVFLDPMVAYMGADRDMNKANETRATLNPLIHMAKTHNIALVGVHHVKKAEAAIAQHRTLGSVDFVNGPRSVLLVGISKSGQYYMKHVKHNWSAEGPTLAYEFSGDKFAWQGEYFIDPEEEHEVSKTPRGHAKAFITSMLRDGPVAAIEMLKLAHEEGINERTLYRAKKGLVRSFQKREGWYWELCPGMEPQPEVIGTTPNAMIGALANIAPGIKVPTEPTGDTSATQGLDPELAQLLNEAKARLQ